MTITGAWAGAFQPWYAAVATIAALLVVPHPALISPYSRACCPPMATGAAVLYAHHEER
jgi:hypothetical protein